MTDDADASEGEPLEDEGEANLGDFLAEMAISDDEPIDSVEAVREIRERG